MLKFILWRILQKNMKHPLPALDHSAAPMNMRHGTHFEKPWSRWSHEARCYRGYRAGMKCHLVWSLEGCSLTRLDVIVVTLLLCMVTCSSLVYSWKHSSRVQLCCCRCCCCWFLTLSASFTTSSWILPNRLTHTHTHTHTGNSQTHTHTRTRTHNRVTHCVIFI